MVDLSHPFFFFLFFAFLLQMYLRFFHLFVQSCTVKVFPICMLRQNKRMKTCDVGPCVLRSCICAYPPPPPPTPPDIYVDDVFNQQAVSFHSILCVYVGCVCMCLCVCVCVCVCVRVLYVSYMSVEEEGGREGRRNTGRGREEEREV